MCNPIEGCFSVLKAAIKRYLALSHDDMLSAPRGQMTAAHAAAGKLLGQAAEMALHCAQAVVAAKRGEPMVYGT
ncbi:hypothetical protein PHYSODRAFT_326371 [Phytophthora sojae]|uniref:Tc1-like transposase DDE domain-containing protein n=1 Tax=Phytophthora sojae (strain P6497) TaxID=1094619 RepID=G4YSA9_PHYSP|nr:hypothetical protein PHYSODRAFT_326371 [Phytophthora sojae]EGZ25340.1 hypothetical protein PHYSODRAFT_326371 [Phytophthora sojae]|eukprot:XP_009520628.1 hypothetical protein PHYSODRAFT_326371 [Phytophthora sojae]